MTTPTNYSAEIAAAQARLAAAQMQVDDLRAKLAAEHAQAQSDLQARDADDDAVTITGRATTAAQGREAARRRFATKADDATDGAQDSAAAGVAAARARFGKRS
jgi:hypothetical protein